MNYFLLLFPIFILVYFLFKKKRPSKKENSDKPVLYLKAILEENVDFYQDLDEEKKGSFEHLVIQFLSETRVEGVGLEVNDLDKVLIASSAVIPVFGFPGWRYKNLSNVLLYPNTFNKEFQFEGGERQILGMVGTGYMNGQMLLSKEALYRGFAENNGKENTAIHEFVHLLDKTDGAVDGFPEVLMHHKYSEPWLKMIHKEMNLIKRGKSDIDAYALTNEAEFLAVAAEYFFEKPEQLKDKRPELYDLLSKIFLQDLAK